jgi:hypothetical protein
MAPKPATHGSIGPTAYDGRMSFKLTVRGAQKPMSNGTNKTPKASSTQPVWLKSYTAKSVHPTFWNQDHHTTNQAAQLPASSDGGQVGSLNQSATRQAWADGRDSNFELNRNGLSTS